MANPGNQHVPIVSAHFRSYKVCRNQKTVSRHHVTSAASECQAQARCFHSKLFVVC